jgi:plasmid replication initiation protein
MLTAPQANGPIPNELVWISNFLSFERELTGEDIENVRNFSILWNLFEGLVCNRNASANALKNAVSNLQKQDKLKIEDYDKFLKYFANRYIENGETNDRFSKLNLRRSDKPELVEAVLKGTETAPEKVLLAILIIVYRYRNNLFHGEKSISDLPNQIDNFRNANHLLMVFMEKWKQPQS